MGHISLYDAKTHLSGLVERAAAGEEFVIALRGNQAGALRFAERLRRNIATKPWHMTASFGIAHAPAGSRPVMDQLLASADHAMYVAKRAGGDRIESIEFGGEYELRRAG